jgi:hypothetical protein
MLPAAEGDAIWLEYGHSGETRRVMIDAGPPATASTILKRVRALTPQERQFELLVVTHIDRDHIGGVAGVLGDTETGLSFNDVWFNGRAHLDGGVQALGPKHGDKLADLLRDHPWNAAWNGAAIVVPEDGALPTQDLAGGLRLTLLSPYAKQLSDLAARWPHEVAEIDASLHEPQTVVAEFGITSDIQALGPPAPPVPRDVMDLKALADAPNRPDRSPANGASIVLLAEFEGHSALLCADAFPSVIRRSLDRLAAERDLSPDEPVPLGITTLPHHGSRHNINEALLSRIACPNYLVSTDGNGTCHPDIEAIALVLTAEPGAMLHFNARSEWNRVWDDAGVVTTHHYSRRFPDSSDNCVSVSSPRRGAPASTGSVPPGPSGAAA